MQTRTLEQRLKFDYGLTIGRKHLVRFTLEDRERKALVTIGRRGAVRYFAEPREGQMYAGWQRVRGDNASLDGGVYVWPAKDAELMAEFSGEPVATVTLGGAE